MKNNVKYVLKEGPGFTNKHPSMKLQPIKKEEKNENQQCQHGNDVGNVETNTSSSR